MPGYLKGMAKWFIDGTLDRQALVGALEYLADNGVLGWHSLSCGNDAQKPGNILV